MTSNTTRIVTIQPAMAPDLRKPYPWHIAAEGKAAGGVLRQDFWRGEPAQLVGFQERNDAQRVALHTRDWLAGDLQQAVGMYPVFMDADGGMWHDEVAIATVTEFREKATSDA